MTPLRGNAQSIQPVASASLQNAPITAQQPSTECLKAFPRNSQSVAMEHGFWKLRGLNDTCPMVGMKTGLRDKPQLCAEGNDTEHTCNQPPA